MSLHLYDNISFSNTVFCGFETQATRVQNKLLVVEQSEFLPVHKNTRDTSFGVNRGIVLATFIAISNSIAQIGLFEWREDGLDFYPSLYH